MDGYHRDSRGQDTRNGRECLYCSTMDPGFSQRKPIDRLVLSNLGDAAAAHLTEDGYIRHRLAELAKKRAQFAEFELKKTA